jgi:hypothetical protein
LKFVVKSLGHTTPHIFTIAFIPLINLRFAGLPRVASLDELKHMIWKKNHDRNSVKLARRVIRSVMQTEEGIAIAMEDIYSAASQDGVTCKNFT